MLQSCSSLSRVAEADWQALNSTNHPLLDYHFLNQLETSQSLNQQDWQPNHQLLYQDEKLIAALPLYIKNDSYGEFVFDWAWADAAHQAGIPYYPKLVSAIPFTPVTGDRILVHPDVKDRNIVYREIIQTVIEQVQEQQMSSLHVLFCDQNLDQFLDNIDLLKRTNWHYRWRNQQYQHFDDFLAALNSKRRKQIRKERRELAAHELKIERLTGDDIQAHHWQAFYPFYCETFQRKWGEPRLTYAFFMGLQERLKQNLVLILASSNDEYVAGSFAIKSDNVLYGRHWGCKRQYQHLHFELCYYQTIEFCIEHGLAELDAGIQGEHKIFRGFEPVPCYSYHWIHEPRFRQAVKNYLQHETKHIDEQLQLLNQHLPYKKSE